MADRRQFAMALGGGGARGLAHIGVLRVLEREGLLPEAVAGTSMGAIVGALFAAGVGAEALAETVDLLDLRGLLGVAKINLGPESLLSADAFEQRLRELLPSTFEELTMPFAAVAADLVSGEPVVLTSGDLPSAVRASMSIPIVFEPVRIGDAILVDGGIIDPVPIDAAKTLGRGPVVAVNVGPLTPVGEGANGQPGQHKPVLRAEGRPNVAQVGTRSFDVASNWLARAHMSDAVAVITPDVGGYSMADFLDGPAIVEAGERAAADAMLEVHEALEDAWRTPLARLWRALAGSPQAARGA